jgi:hypothetical protein
VAFLETNGFELLLESESLATPAFRKIYRNGVLAARCTAEFSFQNGGRSAAPKSNRGNLPGRLVAFHGMRLFHMELYGYNRFNFDWYPIQSRRLVTPLPDRVYRGSR